MPVSPESVGPIEDADMEIVVTQDKYNVKSTTEADNDVDFQCGVQADFPCCNNNNLKCAALQRFATPRWTLAILSLAGMLQGFVVHGLVRVVITTIEKRFGMKSTESALVPSLYDGASLLAVPVVTILGGKGHKPRWIGSGILMLSLGTFIFMSPHFAAPPYAVSSASGAGMVCGSSGNQTEHTQDLRSYKYVFIFANIVNGLGSSALLTLGMTYIDENVQQKKSSVYHGIFYAFAFSAGPALGYILGGLSLNLYTNIGESVPVTNSSPFWVGAWWFGFIIAGPLVFLSAVPILLLPRKLPSSVKIVESRNLEVDQSSSNLVDDDGKAMETGSFFDQAKVHFSLLRNIPLPLTCLANALDYGFIVGFSPFLPKFLEAMYGLTASEASLYVGVLSVVGASTGIMTGGLVVSKARLNVPGILKLCLISTVVGIICSAAFMLRCSEGAFVGSSVPYPGENNTSSTVFTSQCNRDCGCTTDHYDPVCGSNGLTYFSPCFAGCNAESNKTFLGCSCVQGRETNAKKGFCPAPYCNGLPIFLVLLFVAIVSTFVCWTPNLQVVVRIVPFHQRSFAVGLQWFLNRTFGMPFPIIIGSALDRACSVWGTEDGRSASCRHYFTNQMSLSLFVILLCCKVCVLLCYGLVLVIYRPSQKVAAEEETPEDAETTRL